MSEKINYIKDEISSIFQNIERKNPNLINTSKVQQAWYESVEESIANHTVAVFVVPNTNCSEVIIYTENSIWTAELNMRSEILRMNLNIKLKEMEQGKERKINENAIFQIDDIEVVKKITFKTSKEKYIKQKPEREDSFLLKENSKKIKPIPLTSDEEQELKNQLNKIEDIKLKNSMFNAMKAQKELEKAKNSNQNK